MAKKKLSKKDLKKIEKEAKKHKGLVVVVLLLVIAIAIFLGYNVYLEKSNYEAFLLDMGEVDKQIKIDSSLTEDCVVPTSIMGYDLTWTTSNENYLSLSGHITRGSYLEGDKTVTLSYKIVYPSKTFLYPYLTSYLDLADYEKSFSVVIQALEPSNLDYINEVLNSLYIPDSTFYAIGLSSTTCYQNVTLSFESSNTTVLENDGTVHTPVMDTLVTLKVTATCEEESVIKEYAITILESDFTFNTISENYDAMDTTFRYGELSMDGITYKNAMIIDDASSTETVEEGETNSYPHVLKLRTNKEEDGISSFETTMINQPLFLSFDYQFAGSQKTENGRFDIYVKTLETDEYTLLKSETVLIRDTFEALQLDLSSYEQVKLKIEFNHGWKTDSFVFIDNLVVKTKITQSELEGSISLLANFTRSTTLPFTTKYGGSVTWKSSDESKITSNGTLVDEASGKVTLTATITYGTIVFDETFEVTIKKTNSGEAEALEIYFIDLGVYGLGDTGECTYIRYQDIDIIVDGGDHFDTTSKAISDVFEAHTLDKVIDYMIITHPDSDHIGGLPYLFETYQVNTVYKFADETFTTQKFKNLKAAYDSEPNCTVYDIYSDVFHGDTSLINLTISEDIYIKFIDTGFLQDKETNGRSIVFELYAYDTIVLMTGDADNGGSHTKLEVSYMDKLDDCDILKVCHHGTENGTYTEFLEKVKPEVCVICNGNYLGNKHSHPNKAPLERINNYSSTCQIYAITGGGIHAEATSTYAYRGSCTLEESLIDRNGTILCSINDAGYTFTSTYHDGVMTDLRDTTYWGILFK